VRAARDLAAGTVLTRADLVVLRPAPREALPAHAVDDVVGKTLIVDVVAGQDLRREQLT